MMKGRLVFLIVLSASWFLAIALRLYDLQVNQYEKYAERASRQQQRVVVLDSPRGTIFDARGRELAVSVEAKSVAADPSIIEDPAATAKILSEILGLNRKKLTAALNSGREFVWVQRKLNHPLAEQIKELKIPGVFLLSENKRYYPLRELAAAVLGYVGIDNAGLAGLEYRYEKEVASVSGSRRVVRDARFGTVLHPSLEVSEAKPGRDLVLTLDATIQHIVERELRRAIESSGARRGMILVMDPKTGGILAMASYPSFDPNNFSEYSPDQWRNLPLVEAYEPGSTFKMVTLAAALEANVVDPLEKIYCGMGGITLSRVRISDHSPFGDLTTREIIAKSSNVGAIKLGAAAGRERLYNTIKAFGFGRPTGIDLPSESKGIVRSLERWQPLSPAYISFGHGISVTALQLTNAFAAIANGGYLLKPYVVSHVAEPGQGLQPGNRRKVVGQPISPSSVTQVRSMLESVVIEGTAKSAGIPGYRAAGKTGTAQKPVPGRGYAANRYIASFAGFAPVRDPAMVASVILDEPWPNYHGGQVAAPVFSAIAQQILLYLGIPPDGERELPQTLAAAAPRNPHADPPDIRQIPRASPPRQVVDPGTVPDLVGLSARQAVVLSGEAGLRLALNGHGAVARQLPSPGTPLEVAGGAVEVWLSAEAL